MLSCTRCAAQLTARGVTYVKARRSPSIVSFTGPANRSQLGSQLEGSVNSADFELLRPFPDRLPVAWVGALWAGVPWGAPEEEEDGEEVKGDGDDGGAAATAEEGEGE
ncbi:hypothetical protein EYF80_058117 [Liparis tanakae]|uniref:Uncharacterized protein n=1 Tax=Liparis tanakae TaxID=230148 RepID=A0A4Z2ES36_9TELE|nr:hypothetical protein EYF80_058117 [Liparis tanakae]